MSFFGRILSSWFADHATEKLANSQLMQQLAKKTIEAQAAASAAAARSAEFLETSRTNPDAAKQALGEGATTFWTALKKEIQKDLGFGGDAKRMR